MDSDHTKTDGPQPSQGNMKESVLKVVDETITNTEQKEAQYQDYLRGQKNCLSM